MSHVIRIKDSTELIPTRLYPHATFPFANFNPPQSALFQIFEEDANFCMAASTSSGKTGMAEMVLSHTVRELNKKVMYISPLKALAQEKIDDWTNSTHHFSDLKLSICTGDYVLIESRKKELAKSDLIILTSEMLASRTRNANSEKNEWIKDVGAICVDESHLLTVPGRGDHLEVALMKLTQMNPSMRIMFLSATLPNVDQVCGWLSALNKKPTYLLESQYRPCPLTIHYHPYEKYKQDYESTEASKVWAAEQIIDDHPNDKFLVFAHTKRTGDIAKKRFQEKGINCEFHNADVSKENRQLIEENFKKPMSDGGNRVILATSTMSWGVNTAARRVILLGVHRGLTLVPTYDISQMVGRAGRPKYDPAGDAYILLPEDKRDFAVFKEHCQTPTYIESQLLNFVGNSQEGTRHYKVLAFHIVSEIHRRNIKTRKDFHQWFRRSLAHFQSNDLDAEIIESVIDLLVNCGAIKENPETKELEISPVGTIASMLYYNPFDVSDFKRNFNNLFKNQRDHLDHAIAMALANIDSFKFGIVSKAEKEEIDVFSRALTPIFGPKAFLEPAIKAGFCYYTLLQGRHNPTLNGMIRGLQYDFDRTSQVLTMIDQMAAKWGRRGWLQGIKTRIKYGVKPHLVGLCGIPEVGAVRSQKLYDAGFRTVADIQKNMDQAATALKMKKDRLARILSLAKKEDRA